MPVRLGDELLQGACGHRAAPDHRIVLLDHEADRVDLQAEGFHRLHRLAVGAHGLAGGAEHLGLGRTVNVRIKHADAGAFVRKREREVGGDRGLADAALTGAHRNDILDAGHDAKRALHLVRDDVLRDAHLNGGGTCGADGLAHGLTDGFGTVLGGIAELNEHLDVAVLVGFGALEHLAGHVVGAGDRVDQRGKGALDRFRGNGHGILLR